MRQGKGDRGVLRRIGCVPCSTFPRTHHATNFVLNPPKRRIRPADTLTADSGVHSFLPTGIEFSSEPNNAGIQIGDDSVQEEFSFVPSLELRHRAR